MYNPYEENEYEEARLEDTFRNVSVLINSYLDELATNGSDITNTICNIRQVIDDAEILMFGKDCGARSFVSWFR